VAADLERQPSRQRDLLELKRRMFDIEVGDGEPVVHFDECFVSGPWNPLGIAIEVHREGDEAVAEVSLGAAFEGAPGRSHGGIVAAIFDDVLGYLLTLIQEPGFTGELTVRYHARHRSASRWSSVPASTARGTPGRHLGRSDRGRPRSWRPRRRRSWSSTPNASVGPDAVQLTPPLVERRRSAAVTLPA
jgi:hypothetical protein